ncbi:MAG: RNA methyltransferase [Candidatus Liptonbacteria bacterium]|nr:RNA methyltransferase [Candidatus Liptonbacteria bacterium]
MDFVAVLDNIRSLHNVGSIFRTADGAGIKKIYLCGITPAPVDSLGGHRQQLIKTSLGAEKSVEWKKVSSSVKLLKKLKEDGYKILAVEQSQKSIPYFKFSSKSPKLCLVIGNEVNGLSPSVLKIADKILEIPMHGKKESLNVSVALGIVAYHVSGIIRQWKK